MENYEYKQVGGCGVNRNPKIPGFMVVLGKDADGKEWLCSIQATDHLTHLRWNVDFDTNDEYEVPVDPEWLYDEDGARKTWSSPFLRPEVVYARDYRGMNQKRYFRRTVEYIHIRTVIDDFVEKHGIK